MTGYESESESIKNYREYNRCCAERSTKILIIMSACYEVGTQQSWISCVGQMYCCDKNE
jgi:hypothetical protein